MSEQKDTATYLYEYPKAGVGMRLLAYILDGIFSGIPLFILIPTALVPFYSFTAVSSGSGYTSTAPSAAIIAIIIIAAIVTIGWSLFYFLFRDGFGAGQSWGKKICGLMVVNLETNNPCDMGKSFLRNIVVWFLSTAGGLSVIELIIMLVHERGHRLGDLLAKTQVIDVDLFR